MEPTTICCWCYYSTQVLACQAIFAKKFYTKYLAYAVLNFTNKNKGFPHYILFVVLLADFTEILCAKNLSDLPFYIKRDSLHNCISLLNRVVQAVLFGANLPIAQSSNLPPLSRGRWRGAVKPPRRRDCFAYAFNLSHEVGWAVRS